jgi:hypothetical protein
MAVWYVDWAARTISNERFYSSLRASGVLQTFPSETLKMLNVLNAKHMTSAVSKLTPEAVARAKDAEASLVADLEKLTSPATIAVREQERKAAITASTAAYDETKAVEAAARAKLVETDRFIRTLEPSEDALVKVLKQYGELGLETERAALRELRKAQARRTSRLKYAQTKRKAAAETLGGDEGEALAERVLFREEELFAEQQYVRQIDDEIAQVNNIIDGMSGVLAADELEKYRTFVDALQQKRLQTVEFEVARNNRRVAKRALDAAKRDVVLPRGKGVEVAVETYIAARAAYVNYAGTLRGVPRAQWTADQAAKFDSLKAVAADARSNMKKILGFAGKKAKQPGRQFAAKVVELADRLTAAQLQAARVIADADKLDDYIETIAYGGTSRDAALTAMGDLMRTYRSIRRFVSDDELKTLSRSERAVYEGFVPVYQTRTARFTSDDKLRKLEADLKAAHIRNAPFDEVEKLEKQIWEVTQLTNEKGMRLIGAGKQVRIPKSLEDVYADQGTRDVLERMHRLEQDPSEFEKWVASIYDPLALLWKTGATVGRGPAFTITNLVGGLLNNFLGGVSPRAHGVASKVIFTYRQTVKEVLAANPDATDRQLLEIAEKAIRRKLATEKVGDVSAVEAFDEFLRTGAWFSTDTVFQMEELKRLGLLSDAPITGQREQVTYRFAGEATTKSGDAFRRTTNFMLTNPVQKSFNDLAQQSEVFMRFAAFAHGYSQYRSRWAAYDVVRMLHFDYQDLSDAERSIKRFVPFYT